MYLFAYVEAQALLIGPVTSLLAAVKLRLDMKKIWLLKDDLNAAAEKKEDNNTL